MKPSWLYANLALVAVNLLYGINYSILKIVTPVYIKPFGFIVYRVLIAGMVFWLITIGNREKINWKEDGGRLFLCAVFGVTINQLIFFKGISLTSAVNASIIITTIPIFVYVFSIFLLAEKVHWRNITGIIVGLCGAFVIILKPDRMISSGNSLGDLLIIGNTLSFGLFLVLVKPLMLKYSALTVTKWVFTIGFFMVLPVGFREASVIVPSSFGPEIWWSIGFVILGATVLVYFLNNWALRTVRPTLVSIYVYSQPIFATMVAVIFFDENLRLIHLLAIVLVFSGVYLVGKRS